MMLENTSKTSGPMRSIDLRELVMASKLGDSKTLAAHHWRVYRNLLEILDESLKHLPG